MFKHLDWIGFMFTMLGLLLNANKISWCWPVWLASNLFWILHFYPRKERASVFMNLCLAAFNIYGWHRWS